MQTIDEKQEENKLMVNKMFGLAEPCIMQYLNKYRPDNISSNLFIDDKSLNNLCNPMILKPILENNENIMVFSLEIVPYDYICLIPDNIKIYPQVIAMIGFIYHSVTNVYNSILNSNISTVAISSFIKESMHFELHDELLTFYPLYLYPQRRKEFTRLKLIDDLEKIVKLLTTSFIENQSDDVQIKINQVKIELSKLSDQIENYDTDLADRYEIEKNKGFQTSDRIGIIYKEYSQIDFDNKFNRLV